MSNWSPVAGQVLHYVKTAAASGGPASGYFLKFYDTSNVAISMASASDGTGLLAKASIDSSGYPLNGSSARFIPYIDRDYRPALYTNATDADADTIANADWFPGTTLKLSTAASTSVSEDTIATMVANTSFAIGDFISVKNYSSTILSGVMFFEVVAAATGTADGGEFIDLPNTTPALQARQNFNTQYATAEQFGAPHDGTNGLVEITAALLTGRTIHLSDNRTYDVTGSILIESFQHLRLGGGTTVRSSVSPAIRVKGERGSVKGKDFSSIVRLTTGTASDQGIVKIGHALIADDDDIQYNTIKNLRLIGDDPFGTNGTHTGVDTIGLMCLNLGDFDQNPSDNGLVFFNQVHNILFEDVKEGYLLTASVNAQISSELYFRRIGEFGIHCYAPLIADAEGTNYGVNWNAASRLEGSCAENSFDQMFVDGSFSDTTGIFPIMAFIRLEFRTDSQLFTNVLDESGTNTVTTPAEGYNIDASVTDCSIKGVFNIAPAGTNSSLTTSIWDEKGVSRQRELRIDSLISDLVQVQLAGSAAAPHTFLAGSTTTGTYWPAADEYAISDTGTERYRMGGTTPHVFTGNFSVAGDTTLRTTTPVDDNNRNFGSLSLRWKEIFAANGTINTSDERDKTPITPLTEAEKAAATEIRASIGSFKWKHAIEREESGGNKARIHIGVGAQTVCSILDSHGLEPFDYSFVCYEEWEASPEERKTPSEGDPEGDPEGELVKPALEAGNRYGIRYDELNCFLIAAL